MTERYDLQRVLDIEQCSIKELAERSGIQRRTLQRWKTDGVTTEGADRLATALSLHVGDVWPEWRENAIEAEQERLRAAAREKNRRYRKRHPDRVRKRRMDWYYANQDYVLAKLRTPEARAKQAAYKREWRRRRREFYKPENTQESTPATPVGGPFLVTGRMDDGALVDQVPEEDA